MARLDEGQTMNENFKQVVDNAMLALEAQGLAIRTWDAEGNEIWKLTEAGKKLAEEIARPGKDWH